MRRLVFSVVMCSTALAHSACSWISPYSNTSVRVENASDVVFDSVIVGFEYFPENSRDYGRLDPHTVSAYRTFDWAYSYAYLSVQAGGRTLAFYPTDWSGEPLLSRGRYTYRLTVGTASDGQPQLNWEFVTDRSLKRDLGRILRVFLAIVIALALIVRFVLVLTRDGEAPIGHG